MLMNDSVVISSDGEVVEFTSPVDRGLNRTLVAAAFACASHL